MTENGRIGSLDLRQLEGRIHEFGAYYQAHLAQNLRAVGAEAALDLETGAAHLTASPKRCGRILETHAERGTDRSEMGRRERPGLGPYGTCGPDRLAKRGASMGRKSKDARTDDLSDFGAWRKQADAIGWRHEGALGSRPSRPHMNREDRLEQAYAAALPFVERGFGRSAVVEMAEIRVAAARGLIAAGVDGPEDITDVVSVMGRRESGRTARRRI